jgi:hypothetical protein
MRIAPAVVVATLVAGPAAARVEQRERRRIATHIDHTCSAAESRRLVPAASQLRRVHVRSASRSDDRRGARHDQRVEPGNGFRAGVSGAGWTAAVCVFGRFELRAPHSCLRGWRPGPGRMALRRWVGIFDGEPAPGAERQRSYRRSLRPEIAARRVPGLRFGLPDSCAGSKSICRRTRQSAPTRCSQPASQWSCTAMRG